MECTMISTTVNPFLVGTGLTSAKRIDKFEGNLVGWKRLDSLNCISIGKSASHQSHWRRFCTPVGLEEEFSALQSKTFSKDEEPGSEALPEETLLEPPSSKELKSSLVDSEISKLVMKLSEVNRQNRFLKRQLQFSEACMVTFNSELAIMEFQIKSLISLALEIANYTIPDGSRKILGTYIQPHLVSQLEAFQERMKEHIMGVNAAQLQEVSLFWSGLARSVLLMGSFDDWSEGEYLYPHYPGSNDRFSTKLLLRPGRYEIKFLVDGEWKLSPEFPTVGEGLMQNNLLLVK